MSSSPPASPAPAPASGRSGNAILNFASSLTFTVVTLLGAMASSRLLVRWIGEERFGAFRALGECFGYLTLLELGLGGAIGPLLSRALGTGDRPTLRALLAAGTRAYLGVTVVAIAIGLLLVAALPWIVPVPSNLRVDLRIAGLVTLLGFLTLPMIPLRSLTEAAQRGYRINMLLTFQFLLITVTAVLLCRRFTEWSLTSQAAAATLGAVVFNLLLLRATLPALPGRLGEIARTRPDAAVWRGITALSWPTLVLQFSGRINLQTDSIVVGQVLGTAAVTSLFVTQRLAQMAQQQICNVGAASWAGLAELYHRGEHELFRRRLLELFRLVAILGLAAIGPIVAYNHHFVLLWMPPSMGAKVYGGDLVAVVAGVNALALGVLSLSGWCITGTGRVRMMAIPSLVSASINLSASVLLTSLVGVAGPLLGTTVAIFGFSMWVHAYLLRREFGLPLRGAALSVAVPLCWGIPYTVALQWLAASQVDLGWLQLILQMGLASLGFLALAAAAILGPSERLAWRARLGAIRGRLHALARAKTVSATP